MKATFNYSNQIRLNKSMFSKKSNYWNNRRRYISMGYFEAANLIK